MKNKEDLVDLSAHSLFNTGHLGEKKLLLIPSQGEPDTKILTGIEGEMLYEHRQEGQAICESPGIFISRVALPKAEDEYRSMVFGEKRPSWMIPQSKKSGVPLDQIILADEGFLDSVADVLAKNSHLPTLYGFNETPQMKEISSKLGIKYYGNHEFANWAGTKIGLQEFAKECGVPTPMTFAISNKSQFVDIAKQLAENGYKKLVVKVNHSTGGMGHAISDIKKAMENAIDGNYDGIFPEEFMESEGAVVQGWIPEAISASLATFVDFDGSTYFEGAQAHVIDQGESAFGAIGAMPISRNYLEPMIEVGKKLAVGYANHQAWGSHTMGMLIVPPEISLALGLPPGVPLCNDENTRPGASTISKAWILALREGRYGIGWMVSKIAVSLGTKIEQVVKVLDNNHLLIKKADCNASGIFVFNGSVLDSGYENKFYAIAISKNDDPDEAKIIMSKAVNLFK